MLNEQGSGVGREFLRRLEAIDEITRQQSRQGFIVANQHTMKRVWPRYARSKPFLWDPGDQGAGTGKGHFNLVQRIDNEGIALANDQFLFAQTDEPRSGKVKVDDIVGNR